VSQVFPSAKWADGFKQAINANDNLKHHANQWSQGPLALVVEANAAAGLEREMAIWIDLEAGACREACYLEADQARERAAFVIEADYELWKGILQGTTDPNKALMQWKLKLTKGPLPTVIKQVPALRELMVSASRVSTQFS
jgi:putative sterol carrier protein